MTMLKRIFDFYIQSSIHVALSCYAFVSMTNFLFGIEGNQACAFFAFFGTIVAYNFVKYDALARTKKMQMKGQLKAIALLSFFSFLAVVYYFFQLQFKTQIIGIIFLVLTLLYTLPFFPNRKNARNWAGVKIYIVTLCWVGVTLALPVINAEIPLTFYFYSKFFQRFLLVFVLILIFEIIDLKKDDPHLQTVPQQIGVTNTKLLGYALLGVFVALEIFNIAHYKSFFGSRMGHMLSCGFVALSTALFLAFADENKSKYYSSFWAESVPIFWLIFLLTFG